MIEAAERELLSNKITDADISSYRENGFITVAGVFGTDEIVALRRTVELAVASERGTDRAGVSDGPEREAPPVTQNMFVQRVDLWRRHPSVRVYTLSPRLARMAERLAGSPLRIWHDQALFKEPSHATANPTPWHQDSPLWPHSGSGQISIWIALSPTTTRNGCLTFMPGSHRVGALPRRADRTLAMLAEEAPSLRSVKPVACALDAGDVTFHDGLTVHYAGPNRSDDVRRGFAIIYMPRDTLFDGTPHLVTQNRALEPGQPFPDAIFPPLG